MMSPIGCRYRTSLFFMYFKKIGDRTLYEIIKYFRVAKTRFELVIKNDESYRLPLPHFAFFSSEDKI